MQLPAGPYLRAYRVHPPSMATSDLPSKDTPQAGGTVLAILVTLSVSHMLNDTMQSLLPSIYPMLKTTYGLSFTQIGLITLTYQITASILQPIVGLYADRRPRPYSLVAGMAVTLVGLVLISRASSYSALLVAAAFVGTGSSIFHPEASRVAHLAAGKKHGFAQSLFQVGGNLGRSLGPLLAAAVIVVYGQRSIAWFSALALVAIAILFAVGRWYAAHLAEVKRRGPASKAHANQTLSKGRVILSLGILVALVFSKYFYLISISNYYTFYLIARFGVSLQQSQVYLFIFLVAAAAGTIMGGPLGDRFGRKYVIWFSILGVAPFTLVLPYAGLTVMVLLSAVIGFILASAFSAILVYAQELIPGNVGMIAGIFFGLAFGVSGIASAALGSLADHTSIAFVFHVCSFLPLIGLLTVFLPDLSTGKNPRS